MTTYTITTDHPSSSYGEPVLLDAAGNPHKAGDVGCYGLPRNLCGRVDIEDGDTHAVRWSGYGSNPDKMWRALRQAHEDYPHLTTVEIVDAGKMILRA